MFCLILLALTFSLSASSTSVMSTVQYSVCVKGRWFGARLLDAEYLLFDDDRDLLLCNSGDLLLYDTGELFGGNVHDLSPHDTLDLLLYDLRDFPAMYNFAFLLYLPVVRHLVDRSLDRREALVYGVVHASNRLQVGL
ncbi:hypothetical protein Q7P35_009887 [Cladosporium inversicolor]